MKITKNQYLKGRLHLFNIYDLSILGRYSNNKIFQFQSSRILLADNREKLKNVFGEPHWKWRGEFLFHTWVLEYCGDTFIINTAKNKGTSYEVVRNKNEELIDKAENCIKFLEFVELQLTLPNMVQ